MWDRQNVSSKVEEFEKVMGKIRGASGVLHNRARPSEQRMRRDELVLEKYEYRAHISEWFIGWGGGSNGNEIDKLNRI